MASRAARRRVRLRRARCARTGATATAARGAAAGAAPPRKTAATARTPARKDRLRYVVRARGRYRQGATGPPSATPRGNFLCDSCDAKFPTNSALSGHRRFCDGGKWSCDWCGCKRLETSGRAPGPKGPRRSVRPAAADSRRRQVGTLKMPGDGQVQVRRRGSLFDSIGALSGHRRFCDGGSWRCDWCSCTISEGGQPEEPGPKGPATLCGPCGGAIPRRRHGAADTKRGGRLRVRFVR